VLGLGAHFLAGDHFHAAVQPVLRPLAFQGLSGSLRNADRIGLPVDAFEAFAHEREGRHALDDILDGGVDGIGPAFDWFQAAVAMLDFPRRSVALPSLVSRPIHFFEGAGFGDQDFAGDDLRVFAQQVRARTRAGKRFAPRVLE